MNVRVSQCFVVYAKVQGKECSKKILPPLSFWKRLQFPTGAEHPIVSAPAVHFIFLSFKWALMFGRPFYVRADQSMRQRGGALPENALIKKQGGRVTYGTEVQGCQGQDAGRMSGEWHGIATAKRGTCAISADRKSIISFNLQAPMMLGNLIM